MGLKRQADFHEVAVPCVASAPTSIYSVCACVYVWGHMYKWTPEVDLMTSDVFLSCFPPYF